MAEMSWSGTRTLSHDVPPGGMVSIRLLTSVDGPACDPQRIQVTLGGQILPHSQVSADFKLQSGCVVITNQSTATWPTGFHRSAGSD
jgi:hypothetical protein